MVNATETSQWDVMLEELVFKTDLWSLNVGAFILYSACVVVLILFSGLGFWVGRRVNTRLHSPPKMEHLEILMLLYTPAFIGVTLAALLASIPLTLVYISMGGYKEDARFIGVFDSMQGDFLHSSLSDAQVRGGRYGMALCLMGAIAIRLCLINLPMKDSILEMYSASR